MPNGVGFQEILLIGLLVFLLFGAKGMSGVMRDLGRWTGKFKKYRDDFTRELMAMSEPVVTPEQIKKNERKRIRTQTLKTMRALTPDERAQQSKVIAGQFMALEEYKNAASIFTFLSMPEEVDTSLIVTAALKDGKAVYAPFCIPETRELGIARISEPANDIAIGLYGIPEPKAELRGRVDAQTIDLFVIPGVSFDYELTRLGRGAGYFDRFLAPLKGKRRLAAVAFEQQIYPYTLPREEHDINPDLVITPNLILRPKS